MIVEVIDGVEYDVTPRSLLGGERRSASSVVKAAQDAKGAESRAGGITRVHGAVLDSRIQESKDFGFSYSESGNAPEESTQSAGESAMERLLNVGAHKNAKEELASKQNTVQGSTKDSGLSSVGINKLPPSPNAPLTEEQKEKLCEILLEETATTTLLQIRGLCVMKDSETDTKVTLQNEVYDKLVQSKLTSDNFSERAAQTFNFAPKSKEAMAAPPATRDSGVQSSAWDIYDNTNKKSTISGDDEEARRRRSSILGNSAGSINDSTQTKINEVVTSMLMSKGCLVDLNRKIPTPPQPVPKKEDKRGRVGGGGGGGVSVGGSRAVGGSCTCRKVHTCTHA